MGLNAGLSAGLHASDPSFRYFVETGQAVGGPFLDYWDTQGGLSSYGYPITDEIRENGYTVQYFERARFEYHPENAGTPYAVLLGRLGVQLTSTRDFPAGEPDGKAPYFAETRHSLRGDFLDYWQTYGGLPRFGYPISEEIVEFSATDRRPYSVQYFERARFEYHPENSGQFRVLLGHIGKEMLALRRKAATFVQVVDGQLVESAQLAPLRLKGFNYFPRDFAWADFDRWPAERVAFEMRQMRSLGANALRVFMHYDAFGGAQARWGQQEGFRRFVEMARANGFHLVVGLMDELRKAPAQDWGNWPAAGTPEEAEDKAYIQAVVSPWKDETAILAWDVYNEPDYVSEREWQWAEHRNNRLNWLARMAAEIRRADPNHLLTVGVAVASSNTVSAGGVDLLDIVDFASVHYYSRNYGQTSLSTVLTQMKGQTRKPLLVEEAGYATLEGPQSEQEQARFVGDVMSAVRTTNTSGALVWTLYDFPAHADNSEGHYGLFRPDDTQKPAVDTFRDGY